MALIKKLVEVVVAKCNLCGHEWVPRKEGRPARCPKCESPRWDAERRRPPIAEQRANAQKRQKKDS